MLELESEGQAKTHNKDKAFILFLQNLVIKFGCGKANGAFLNVQIKNRTRHKKRTTDTDEK
jgi:hypothetical protein